MKASGFFMNDIRHKLAKIFLPDRRTYEELREHLPVRIKLFWKFEAKQLLYELDFYE
jgi:hypothetical protein